MALGVAQKVLKAHLVHGELRPGEEIAISIDQTLTQDATGTMAYLQFEAMGLPRVRTKLSVSYVDHNTLQTGFENADDHLFLQTVAAKYGIYFSRPGNGICHQVHLERFGVPGQTLLGSDSHTPTAGGLGMIAIGAGGLDVAVAMGGGPFYLTMPKIRYVHLKGRLQPWVSAKDIILEMLRLLTVKGGVGWIIEYGGPALKYLTVPERATITNMGAELGATTSIFPSDEQTRAFLRAQRRARDWRELKPDKGAKYDDEIEIDLNELEPLIACPHSPDNVKKVSEVKGIKVNQVCVGSCTNSSYMDLMVVGRALKGKHVHPNVSMVLSPGSKQVYEMIAKNGVLADIIAAGVRVLESTCGPCIGMGQAPPSGGVSVRTFNRNFVGRSGTQDAQVYLASAETAVACALTGEITDPRTLGPYRRFPLPERFIIDDEMILPPAKDPEKVEIIRGPNIAPLPMNTPLPDTIKAEVLLKLEDNISTDHILPAGAKILPLRSNIPRISEYVFSGVDPTFSERAKAAGAGVVVGGENYGQGSSREHAALAPMYLGLKAVLAKSFARIHHANLINFGILPLTFEDPKDYDKIEQGDILEFSDLIKTLRENGRLTVTNVTKGVEIPLVCDLKPRQKEIIIHGGLLNFTKSAHR
jgi:aconitate hydratase